MPPLDEKDNTNLLRQRQSTTTHTATPTNTSTPINTTGPNISKPKYSSAVVFYPPSTKYWRIGNQWYDFTEFLAKHPGGAQAILLSRDRFEDATFVFEAHHHEFMKTRAIIKKYLITDPSILNEIQTRRPVRGTKEAMDGTHFDSVLDASKHPDLLDKDAFYSVMRVKVSKYLKDINCRDGGPTTQCLVLFWFVFSLYVMGMCWTWSTGYFHAAGITAVFGALLGAFGHNWVHQPKYKDWGWALLSLDVLGFSSESWFREHNLQHHMYTNTPWDNHFIGTEVRAKMMFERCCCYLFFLFGFVVLLFSKNKKNIENTDDSFFLFFCFCFVFVFVFVFFFTAFSSNKSYCTSCMVSKKNHAIYSSTRFMFRCVWQLLCSFS